MGRRSRKQRPGAVSAPPAPPRPPRRSADERNAEVRAQLEPYEPGERPLPLLVGAGLAALLGIGNLVAYAAGMEINGKRPAVSGILIFCALMGAMAWGMWSKRYWAVLGFQALVAITVVVFFLLLLRASSVLDVVIAIGVMAPLGLLFWKLVRVLARIQTPERPGAR